MKRLLLFLFLLPLYGLSQNPQVVTAKSLRFSPVPGYRAAAADSSVLMIDRATGRTYRTNIVASGSGSADLSGLRDTVTAKAVRKSILNTTYAKTSFASGDLTSTFTQSSGGGFSVASGEILVSGGSADFTKTLALNVYTVTEKFRWSVDFVITGSLAVNGLGIGIVATNSTFPQTFVCWYRPFDSIQRIQTLFSTSVYYNSSTPKFSVAVGDTVTFTFERNINLITSSLLNKTKKTLPVITSYLHNAVYGQDFILPTVGKPCIFNVGGSFKIVRTSFQILETKNCDLLIVGDSKASGYWSGEFKSRIASQLQDRFGINVAVLAGSGAKMSDLLDILPEAISLRPSKVLMFYPSNSPRAGVLNDSTKNQYSRFVSAMESAGSTVYHLGAFREAVQDNSWWEPWLYTAYPPNKIIPAFEKTKTAGFLVADSIHPSPIAQTVITDAIIDHGGLNDISFNSSRQSLREIRQGFFTLSASTDNNQKPVLMFKDTAVSTNWPAIERVGDYLRFRRASDNGVNSNIDAGIGLFRNGLYSGSTAPYSGEGFYLNQNSNIGYLDYLTTSASSFGPYRLRGSSVSLYPSNIAILHATTAGVSVGGATTPVSTLDVTGSVGSAIRLISATRILDATDHTIIVTNSAAVVTLPAAASATRREYLVVNQTASSVTISSYLDFSGTSAITISANSSITIQSDGSNWYRIK